MAAYAIHKYFQDNGYVYFHAPLITSSDCEGAGEMFQVTTLDLNKVAETGKVDYDKDFFGKMASLTVSGQLEGETFAMAYKKFILLVLLLEQKILILKLMLRNFG